MTIKISGTFKKDQREYNGVEDVADDLIKHPFDRIYGTFCLETKKIVENVDDGGTKDVTIRFLQLEPAVGEENQRAIKEILNAAFRARTGSQTDAPDQLPIGEAGAATERPKDEWLGDGEPPAKGSKGRK